MLLLYGILGAEEKPKPYTDARTIISNDKNLH
jgi:hypothetical protein